MSVRKCYGETSRSGSSPMAAVASLVKGGNELEQATGKALNAKEEAPKRKHVRSI